MSCSVNLVPITHLQARARLGRRAGWGGFCGVFLMLVTIGWGAQRIGAGALQRLNEEVTTIDAQRAETQRRSQAASLERDQLVDQLRTLAAARRPQPWPRRLIDLTREAPEGLFLTNLTIAVGGRPSGPDAAAYPGRNAAPRATPEAPSELKRIARELRGEDQTLRLLGQAQDHNALLQFVTSLQGLPGWRQVDLMRAMSAPGRVAADSAGAAPGGAVTFELECQTGDEPP